MASTTDQEARRLARARAFDQATLASIYDEFHESIYRYIQRQVDEEETARDLTSDVFRRLLQALKQGNGPERHLQAWLYRTAHNITVDYFRAQQYRRYMPLTTKMKAEANDPAAEAQRHIQTDEVLAAWTQLTPDQQQVIALKFMQELTNEETAAVLDKPVGAVKSLQHRALATLRRKLGVAKETRP